MDHQYPQSYRAGLLISCGLFLAACALPAVEWWKTPDSYRSDDPLKGEHYVTAPGWACLAEGWMFVLGGGKDYSSGAFAWLANPLALLGVVLLVFRRPTGAAAFGGAAVLVGALFMIDPPGQHGHKDIPRVGAILWLGSFLALAIAALVRRGRPPTKKLA